MSDLGIDFDPKYAHLPLSTQRRILVDRLEREEEERKDKVCRERVEQMRSEIAAEREAEAARKAAFEARHQAHVRRDTPFVMTSAAQIVLTTIDRCERFGHNGLIIGAPGVGKTRALEEAVRRSGEGSGPLVGLVTVTGLTGKSAMALFQSVASHLGVRTVHNVAETHKLLCSRASKFPILLFDEAQNLVPGLARDLLAISEQSHVRMLFLGNDEALKLVNSRKSAIHQIARRLPIREEIDCIQDADADLLAALYDVEGSEALRLCRALAKAHHADGIGKVLPIARAVAEAAGSRTVRSDHLRDALTLFPHFSRDLAGAAAAKRPPTRR